MANSVALVVLASGNRATPPMPPIMTPVQLPLKAMRLVLIFAGAMPAIPLPLMAIANEGRVAARQLLVGAPLATAHALPGRLENAIILPLFEAVLAVALIGSGAVPPVPVPTRNMMFPRVPALVLIFPPAKAMAPSRGATAAAAARPEPLNSIVPPALPMLVPLPISVSHPMITRPFRHPAVLPSVTAKDGPVAEAPKLLEVGLIAHLAPVSGLALFRMPISRALSPIARLVSGALINPKEPVPVGMAFLSAQATAAFMHGPGLSVDPSGPRGADGPIMVPFSARPPVFNPAHVALPMAIWALMTVSGELVLAAGLALAPEITRHRFLLRLEKMMLVPLPVIARDGLMVAPLLSPLVRFRMNDLTAVEVPGSAVGAPAQQLAAFVIQVSGLLQFPHLGAPAIATFSIPLVLAP